MSEKRRPFKIPPKKYQPKGLTVIYEDETIIIVDKVNGLLTVSNAGEKEKTAHFILNDYVRKGNHRSKNRVFIVHRIDRDTSGLLIFAKSEKAKRYLQDNWPDFSKQYIAVVQGNLDEKKGLISSYLLENKVFKVYSVKDPTKGKLAKTGYSVVKESKYYSLVRIDLFTGKKHQIRVHFAENGHPVVGDKMYGVKESGIKRLALHSASLSITHPATLENLTFEAPVPDYFSTLMR